jgi:hypothetical protein
MSKHMVVDYADTTYIDKDTIGEDGLVKLLPAAFYKQLNHNHLMIWCARHALYVVPTVELVEWLKPFDNAIEICAGNACIGRFLGIPSTDNYSQCIPEISAYYKYLGMVPTNPPKFVEKIDANAAIDKYAPKTVIGCFVTQRHIEGEAEGNMHGPIEEEIINKATYIHIGNSHTHNTKRILSMPHFTYNFPWIVTRSINPDKNVIWLWNL